MTDLTIAICTYRRLEPLRQTLESLTRCEPIDKAWDLLVIDNAGEPAVKALVESFRGRFPVGVEYTFEPATGASHARNHAVRKAAAPIVLFTDDDVTFDPGWLKAMSRAIDGQPGCAFWGGKVDPVFPDGTPMPVWFDPSLCPMLWSTVVRYDRGPASRQWRPDDGPFYTANLALRVDAVARAGYFDTSVGHRGNVRMGMEDSLMIRAIAGQGGAGWYAADAVVHHPVPPERLTRSFARSFAWKQGWMSVELHRGGARGLPAWVYRVAVGGLARGLGRAAMGLFTFNPALAFAGQFEAIYNLSRLYNAVLGKHKRPA